MSFFKRFSTTVITRLDGLVGQIENHEAVVDASLQETRQAVARARVRLSRVQRDGDRLRQQLASERENIQRWEERAKRAAADESRALECLRRRRNASRRVAELEAEVARHEDTATRLERDIRAAGERLHTINRQRNRLRSRASAADARRVLADAELPPCLEDTLERWEESVLERELAVGEGDDATDDTLARDFAAEEDEADLRAELAELLDSHTPTDTQKP